MTAYDPSYTQASQTAVQVDQLFFALLALSGGLVAVLMALIVFFCLRYRRGARTGPPGGIPEKRQMRWEWGWIIAPLLVYVGLFLWSGWLYLSQHHPPENALEIHAVGKQWMWKFQHPGGQREINELHLPVGRPVQVIMTSQDVIHSFYVPAFRVKQDLLPGRSTGIWFTPVKTGRYRLFCAEYCGTSHARMGGGVWVMEAAAYQDWLDRQGSPAGLAASGKQLFHARGCSGCHRPRSSAHAPELAGIYGRSVRLRDGTEVVADETYLRESILDPHKRVVAGYAPIMPSFRGQLGEADLRELIAYLKSLGPPEPRSDYR